MFKIKYLRKKHEDLQLENWQQQQRERQRRNRLRALRLDPAWSQVRGGDQALEDIEHRRCYKQVVERERLIQYHMDREEMLSRVWQMPPLFERQATVICFRFTDQTSQRMNQVVFYLCSEMKGHFHASKKNTSPMKSRRKETRTR